MNTLKIILLIVQLGMIGFLLFYALPSIIKSRRETNKKFEEVREAFKETEQLTNLCMPIFRGTATDSDITAFQSFRATWEKKHGKVK